MRGRRALVVGASGIVGLNVAEHLRDVGGWEIVGLSRRPAPGRSWIRWLPVDLLDPAAAARALADVDPTHVFYCTWTLGRNEEENIRLNGGMLRTVLAPYERRSVRDRRETVEAAAARAAQRA